MAINRFAGFLLNWLDAKNRGALPQEFAPQLMLNASADAFYDSETLDFLNFGAGTVFSLGTFQTGAVPAGFAFIPHAVTFNWVIGTAASTFTGRPIIGRPGFGNFAALDEATVTPGALPNGYTDGYVWKPPQRIVLAPGTSFGWEVSALAGTVVGGVLALGVRVPLT